jgi:hypothetical protein
MAQVLMVDKCKGSEIGITFVELGTSHTPRSNPNLSFNDLQ